MQESVINSLSKVWEQGITRNGVSQEDQKRAATLAARQRDVDVEVSAGHAAAFITAGRRTQYEVAIELAPLSDKQWDAFLHAVAKQPSQTSALLTGDNQLDLAQTVTANDIDFAAESNEITFSCTCSMPADLCNHTLATIGLLTETFHQNPFEYFLFRGKTHKEITTFLTASQGSAVSLENTLDSLKKQKKLLPDSLALPKKPQKIKQWASAPPPNSPFTQEDLLLLSHDACKRAHALVAAKP